MPSASLLSMISRSSAGVGVEEYLLQEEVVLVEHSLGDAHVSLECCSRRVLVFHYGGEDEGADEWYGEGVCDGAVVFLEGVLVDVESQFGVEVLEEEPPYEVALVDDDGVLL